MSNEREHLDQLALELRADLRAAGSRLWQQLGHGEVLAGMVRRHPIASAGGGVGFGFLAARLLRAAIRHPRRVWSAASTVLKTMTSNALTPLAVVATDLAKSKGAAATGNGHPQDRHASGAKAAGVDHR